MFFLLLLCLICCHTPEEAQEFLEQKEEFESSWWESDLFGVCLLVNPEDSTIVFNNENGTELFPYEFESPNIYHVESYSAKVFPNEHCYDIVVGLMQETICECSF
tara:strand:- start:493 stop:807 length:315 start_codon:yes stop_codon:yes gene_type:complete